MSRNSKEHNRIYIKSRYSGMLVGYIEVREDTAEYITKKSITNNTSSSFISFYSTGDKHFEHQTTQYDDISVFKRITGTNPSSQSYSEIKSLPIKFDKDLYRDSSKPRDSSGSKQYRYDLADYIKTTGVFYANNWYFPTVDAPVNTHCGHSIEYAFKIHLCNSSGTSITSVLEVYLIGRQFKSTSRNAIVFELGEGDGRIITFSSYVYKSDGDQPGSGNGFAYVNYQVFSTSGGGWSFTREGALAGQTGGCCGRYENTYLMTVKKDTGNPYVFYANYYYNGSCYFRMHVFNSSGTFDQPLSASNYSISNAYGFSIYIGQTQASTGSPTTYNLFFVGYFDRNDGRFKVGLKASNTANKTFNNDPYVLIGEQAYSNFNSNQYKVTHNGGSTLKYPNETFSYGSEYFELNSPRSMRVNRDMKNESKCNGEEDYVLIGDYFYYCVASCHDYFNSLTLKAPGADDSSCEYKILFTDFEDINHRCVTGYVDTPNICPDLAFNGRDAYKFKYISGDYIEYRLHCGDEYIPKPSNSTLSAANTESATCSTCNYASQKILESSTYVYYNNSGNQSTKRKKYCIDDCDIEPFTITFKVDDGGTTKTYCTETCISANSTTDVPIEKPFHNLKHGSVLDECWYHCPSPRNYITSTVSSADIAGVLTKPACNAACPNNIDYRVHIADYTDAFDAVVTHKYCLDSCTTDGKLFTQLIGVEQHCVTACPADEAFYYYSSSADPQYCISVCPSSHPYIVGYHTHTGPPAEVVEGKCDVACESSTHYKYEMTTGVYLCLEQCYPNPNPVSNICADSICEPYRSFFKSDRICVKECPTGFRHLNIFSGALSTVLFDSTRGLCDSDCPATHFKYINPISTCMNCPDSCTEDVIANVFYLIETGSQPVSDLNNLCAKANCMIRCYEDKPYWDSSKICHEICPDYIPFVNPEHPSEPFSVTIREGFCKSSCDSGYDFRYNIPDDTHQYFCLKQCELPKEFFIRYTGYNECVYECPFHLRYIHPITKECLDSCPSTYPYYNFLGVCMEKCDDNIYEWECNSTCKSGFNYVVHQGCAALCPKTYIGWDCQPNCSVNFPSHINKYCAITCLANQFIDEVVNFKQPNELGVCKGTCADYLLQEGTFSSGMPKIYCVPECPDIYLKEIRSSTEKWCRLECNKESAWKFTILNESCVSDCIDEGFSYISEEYWCLMSCSLFIDLEIWCVSKCPKERAFVYNQHCVSECPGNARFIEDFTYCVPECDSYNYDAFCVDACDSPELVQYYSDNQLEFETLSFIHSTKSCASACNEPGFEWINQITNECISTCPMACQEGICPYPDMKFKEPTQYCKKVCDNEDYPFTDEESNECLSDCTSQRRFFVEEDKFCLSSCPKEKPKIFEKAACEDRGVCEIGCGNIHFVCVDSCPKEANFIMRKNDEQYCLCVCPEFFRPRIGTNICELFCDENLGLIPNQAEDGCDACINEGLFLWQDECIRQCPLGTVANFYNSCRTCKQLGLWKDSKMSCIKFHDCSEISLFDYANQICTECEGEGMMARKVYPMDFVCLKTDCSDGHIVEGEVIKCFVCPVGWFFYEENCYENCPEGLFNDYVSSICTDDCFSSCSEDCCVNGNCRINIGKAICTCEDYFFGQKCDLHRDNINSKFTDMESQLTNKLANGILYRTDTNALLEYYFYAISQLTIRRQLLKVDTNLPINLRYYIDANIIQYAFQPTILKMLDSLILIEKLVFLQTGESKGFNGAINLLDNLTDDIQIFLTGKNEIAEFEKVYEGKFKGQAFTFQFGIDIQETEEVNIDKCVERILQKDNLPLGTRFPFKLLHFSKEVEANVTRVLPKAFNLSSSSKFELSLYSQTGIYPLNDVCEEKYVDTVDEVTLEPQTNEKAQTFANKGINVFDITTPFFNDKCIPHQSEDGKDLTLAERKVQIFTDPSEVCAESSSKVCSVDSFTEEGEAVCKCRGIQDNKKSTLESVASTYPQTNYILIFCYDTFREANIFRNVGFYVVFLSFIGFTLIALRSIFNSDKEIHSPKRFAFIRNDATFFNSDSSMKIEIYFEQCYALRDDLDIFCIQRQENDSEFDKLSQEEKKELFKVLPTVGDLKCLKFEQLVEFDRRSHFQFALDTLVERNSLLNAFYMDSLVFPKYFRIMLFLTEFNLNITLNAFFIDDELIENFNEQEETDFFFSLTNEMTKTIWALLTSKLIMTIFNRLYYVSTRNKSRLLRRMNNLSADYVKRAFNLFLLKTRIASLILSFVVIVFNVLCLYFVVIFCEVYKNSMDIWTNGIYMGWIYEYLVFGGFIPLLLVGSRYLASKDSRLSFFYNISNLIDVLLSLGLS